MSDAMNGKKLLVIGGGSGIGRQIAADALAAGAHVVLAGRDREVVDGAVARIADEGVLDAAALGSRVLGATVDLNDEDSIRLLAEQIGDLDYLVSVAAAHANGPVTQLDRTAVTRAFDAKVIGPILLAKHFATRIRGEGAILLFSGVAAWRPAPGRSVMATANGAVSFLAEALAVELAPIRVNALSPGIVDSGSWDGLGADKQPFLTTVAAANPARRFGRPSDISAAALLALTNPFLTGTTLHIDGGGRLA
ncbi:SDR family oxidoreductase [Nocardia anaemiae]|uniref:SDR family oxidoreductase n=1 Tax=Nocardia anaemiae TaxID=263910 RepID=UPI0007A4FCB5|nr:SDR family oxidoreductase [Nocardia anaemiae]